MQGLSEQQLLMALLALVVIVVVARTAGEVARRFDQPEVLGEFVAGFVLGPSVLGLLLPQVERALFQQPQASLVLSGLSWLGAIFLLLIAGLEVDLAILRAEARPGALAAALAIVPSLIAGTLFAFVVLGRPVAYAFFLGIVLSVTAVSVAAKILIEREVLRRRYAQVILAAGIVSEVLVWLMVSLVSAAHQNSPRLAVQSFIFAIGFLVLMMTLGRSFTYWAMRRVTDDTHIIKGQFSLVLALTLLSAALTHALGLHPLLGAFMFGVVLRQAPRTNRPLHENIQTLTSSFFAPIFFTLAGMKVNIWQLPGASAIGTIALLFVVATVVKVTLGGLGARLGGLPNWEAAAVGLGLTMKGGTDVIVAIVGVELGLFAPQTYTMYAVVAILTVFLLPPMLTFAQRKAPPSAAEVERLEREEAARRAYVPEVEHVLVPRVPQLLPGLVAPVVQRIAEAKRQEHQIFDITEFVPREEQAVPAEREPAVVAAARSLNDAGTLKNVQRVERPVDLRHVLRSILEVSRDFDLIALGGKPSVHRTAVSFGRLQDAVIQRAEADVLLLASGGETFDSEDVRRILVPTNGLGYSMNAGDIAAYSAKANDAELVLLHVVSSEMDPLFWHERDHRLLARAGETVVGELAFRIKRLGVRVSTRVVVGTQPGEDILKELHGGDYQLVVMGGYNRGSIGKPYLGGTIRGVVGRSRVPALLLLAHMT